MKRRNKILFAVLLLFILLFGVIYWLLHNRLEYLLKELVRKESNGTVELELSSIDIQFRKGKVDVYNAILKSNNASPKTASYSINVPYINLSLTGWKPLLQKKLEIDSIKIEAPAFNYTAGKANEAIKTKPPKLSAIFDLLKTTSKKLGVHSLQINDAQVSYSNPRKDELPIHLKHMFLRINNFSSGSLEKGNLLPADDFDFRMGTQELKLKNGKSTGFKSIHFSAKDEYVNIDSCVFTTSNTLKGFTFTSERVMIQESHIENFISDKQVLVDTLLLIKPVVSILSSNEKKGVKDSADKKIQLQTIFSELGINYALIKEGEIKLEFKGDQSKTYSTGKSNISISGFRYNPQREPHLEIDEIDLELKQIQFWTRDSQYVLTVGRFGFSDGDLLCKNSNFKPGPKNKKPGNISIELPSFRLDDISIDDLIQKKLVASEATLLEPEIIIDAVVKEHKTKGKKNINAIYTSLGALAELLTVPKLIIQNGTMQYKLPGTQHIDLSVTGIDVDLKLNRFLQSDNLLEVKTSFTNLSIKNIAIATPTLEGRLSNLKLLGTQQLNFIKQLELILASGVHLTAANLFWQQFNWDKMINENRIVIDSLSIPKLQVSYINNPDIIKNKDSAAALPELYFRKIKIEEVAVDMKMKNAATITANGRNILLDEVVPDEHFLAWSNLEGNIHSIHYQNPSLSLASDSFWLRSNGLSQLKQTTIIQQNQNISIPLINFYLPISNFNFQELLFNSIEIQSPVFQITSSLTTKPTKRNSAQPHKKQYIKVKRFVLENGKINYEKTADSLKLFSTVDLYGNDWELFNSEGKKILMPNLSASLEQTTISKKTKVIDAELISLDLKKNEINLGKNGFFSIQNQLMAHWHNIQLNPQQLKKGELHVSNISGSFEQPGFHFKKGEKLSPETLLKEIKLLNGKASYTSADFTVSADTIRWNQQQPGELYLGKFAFTPAISKETFFEKEQWQKDYLTAKSRSITINGMDMPLFKKDSTVHINKIKLTGAEITSSRNKLKPFEHGKEKLMPTQLLQQMKRSIVIDTFQLSASTVVASEISPVTKKEGSIALEDANLSVYNIKSKPTPNDTLLIKGNASVFGSRISQIKYSESYSDSLSDFHLQLAMHSLSLPKLTATTYPLASVAILKGRLDTLFGFVKGNKYYSEGRLNFYYHKLKIKLLNPKDSAHQTLLLALENFAANNIIIKGKNNKSSAIYFLRDREKFIFNYWIKSVFSGLMTGAGVKSERKYKKAKEKQTSAFSVNTKK